MKFQIGDWEVEGEVDEDNHLALYVRNTDETEVRAIGADIAGEHEWAERFTTDAIEVAYQTGEKPSGAFRAAWPSLMDEIDVFRDFVVAHYENNMSDPVEYTGLNGYVYGRAAIQRLIELIVSFGPIRKGWGRREHS